MAEHPVASKLPKATGKLETHPSPRYFRSLSVGPGMPDKFDDYLQGDEPQIALRVVNFVDGTLVSLVFLHTLSDIMGLASLIKAWCLALAGKPDQVAPFVGFREDPMAGVYNAEASTPYLLADRQLSGWRLAAWGIRFMFESWWYPRLESRTICLPEELVMALRKRAKNDLAESVGQGDGGSPVHQRWRYHYCIGYADGLRGADTPLKEISHDCFSVDVRTRIPSIFREDAAYVQNAAVGAFSFGLASEILQTPLGQLALQYRKDLVAQLEPDQVIGLCRLNRQSLLDTGNGIMFGDTSTVLAVVTNLSKARYLTSSILVQPSPFRRTERLRRTPLQKKLQSLAIRYSGNLQPLAQARLVSPTMFGVLGRDAKGNLWLIGDLPHQPGLFSKST